jgi:hypothetical protein
VPRELLTTTDIADALGFTPRRARFLADRRPGFPAPYAETPRGLRLWRRADIEAWAATADRTVGRPRTRA